MLKALIAAASLKVADVSALIADGVRNGYREYVKRAEEMAALKVAATKLAKLKKAHDAQHEELAAAVKVLGQIEVDGIILGTTDTEGKGSAPGYTQLIEAIAAYDADFGVLAQQIADKLILDRAALAKAKVTTELTETPGKLVKPATVSVS